MKKSFRVCEDNFKIEIDFLFLLHYNNSVVNKNSFMKVMGKIMVNANLKFDVDVVLKNHTIRNCEWWECDNMFVGDLYTVITLSNENNYRIFYSDSLVCFQYIDDGNIVDLYYNDKLAENEIASTINSLITKYDNVEWFYDETTDSYDFK